MRITRTTGPPRERDTARASAPPIARLLLSRPRPGIDSALVKALARAHRWPRILESSECGSITELAAAEKIDRSYPAACSV